MSETVRENARRTRGSYIPFVVAFSLLSALSYYVSLPLFRPLAWSALLSFFAYPLYKWIYRRVFRERYSNIAAGITTAAILVLLVVPAALMGTLMAREGIRLYGKVADLLLQLDGAEMPTLMEILPDAVLQRLQPLMEHVSFMGDMFQQAGRWVASSLASFSRGFLGNAFRIVYQLIVIAVASFFMIRDGHLILQYVRDILPLSSDERESLFERVQSLLRAVIYGIGFTAGIQATLGGFAWWLAGLASPPLFAGAMFLLAMIPFVGTPLVMLPGAAYLAAVGEWKAAVMLAAWALMVVSTVDNFIRPLFISEGSKVHILIVFVGVVGGLAAWGFIGLFYGPLIISLFIFFLDSYRSIWTSLSGEE